MGWSQVQVPRASIYARYAHVIMVQAGPSRADGDLRTLVEMLLHLSLVELVKKL